MNIPKLEMLDDDAIKPLDREVAKQYYEMHNIPLPAPPNARIARENELTGGDLNEDATAEAPKGSLKDSKSADPQKKVKFAGGGQIDEDHEGDWKDQEIKKLEQRYAEQLLENTKLR